MQDLPSGAWLVYVGDSRTNKTGDVGVGPTGTWQYQFEQSCPYVAAPVAQGCSYSYAEDGLRSSDVLGQFNNGQFNTNPGNPVLLFCWVGINDFFSSMTPAETYANLQAIWLAARNLNYKVVAFRIGMSANAGADVFAAQVDQLILSDPTLYDALVDPDGTLPITPGADTGHQYYLDGVHPNVAGMGLIAAAVANAITP